MVRDLGKLSIEDIREVFKRINATRYALNAMEIHNARYEGEFKAFAEHLAQHAFFEQHSVFRPGDIRRMQDTLFALQVVTTILSTYFNRDSEIESYLKQYNDEFPDVVRVYAEMERVFDFINEMDLPSNSRAWKKADLFTLLVEVHRVLFKTKRAAAPHDCAVRLRSFCDLVETAASGNQEGFDERTMQQARSYHLAASQASNDRSSRTTRGDAIKFVLEQAGSSPLLPGS